MKPPPREQVRLAELMAAVSLATDLGTGQPMAHALRTCYLAMGVARAVGLPVQDMFDTYYVSLLRFLGCTSEASGDAALHAGDDIAFYEGLAPLANGWIVGSDRLDAAPPRRGCGTPDASPRS
jgi:hypothetical protein